MNTIRSQSVDASSQIMDKMGSPEAETSKERLVVRRSSKDAIVESRQFNCQDILALPAEKISPKRKRKSPAVPWKKPKDMPKRPLSAYNLFFKDQREKLISEGLGFEILAKTIAEKWKTLEEDVKAPFLRQAEEEKKIYESAVAKWRAEQQLKKAKEMQQSIAEAKPVADKAGSDEPYPAKWFQSGNQPKAPANEEGQSYSYFDPSYVQRQTNLPQSVPQLPFQQGYFPAASYPQTVSSYPSPFEQVQVPPSYYGDIHSLQQQEQLRLHNYLTASQAAVSLNEHRQVQAELQCDQYPVPRPSPLGNTAIHPDAATSSRRQQPLDPDDWRTLRRTLDDDAVEFLKSMRFE